MRAEPSPSTATDDGPHRHVDRLRAHLSTLLAKRAHAAEGETRYWLQQRAAHYAAPLPAAADGRASAPAPTSPLADLLDHIARSKPTADSVVTATAAAVNMAAPAPGTLPELEEFRDLWAAIRSEIQLRQSMQEAPEDAGPLNSLVLVHRSLIRMRELSPGYLQHLLVYLDNLAWLDQLQGAGVLAPAQSARGNVGARPARPRPRKPRA